MKKSTNIDLGVLIAIVFASAVISGSLVFFGMQTSGAAASVSDSYIDARIDEGIERYVERKTAEAEEEQARMAVEQAERTSEMAQNVPPVSVSEDHIFGNKDAKISLIEYSDFQCPFCQRFHATAKQIVEAYDGQVNWVYRHYPLSSHDPVATRQAIGSECVAELAGNDAFWELGDIYFSAGPTDNESIIAAAVELGADEAAMRECLENERYADEVARDMAEATASGVTGTPGNILINNETGEAVLVEGAQPFPVFQQIIDEMLL